VLKQIDEEYVLLSLFDYLSYYLVDALLTCVINSVTAEDVEETLADWGEEMELPVNPTHIRTPSELSSLTLTPPAPTPTSAMLSASPASAPLLMSPSNSSVTSTMSNSSGASPAVATKVRTVLGFKGFVNMLTT
jgi:hypothetical protein